MSQQSMDNDPRDTQQIRDDDLSSGESVIVNSSSDTRTPSQRDDPNQAANKEPAEGSRENAGNAGEDAGGISNRPLSEEEGRQNLVPPRGESKGDGSHA
jgi:hypothetical protein